MDNENILTWSATNMITIWLMALIGALLFMLAAKAWKNSQGGNMGNFQQQNAA